MKLESAADNERHLYIDALRVIAIMLMFFFHVSMIFAAESDWHIKNREQSRVLLEINYFLSFFRMPLLFLVSGYISAILLSRFGCNGFIRQRFHRLIIPLIVWTFILVAPQIFLERRMDGYDGSYLEFYKSFLQFEWWPNGNFHWLHLWFIPYLFIYGVLLIPFYLVMNDSGSLQKSRINSNHAPVLIFFYVLIASTPYALLTFKFPVTYDLINDWARHSLYFPFALAGFLAFVCNPVIEYIEAKRTGILRYAFLTTLLIFTLRWNDWTPFHVWDNWIDRPETYLYLVMLNINSWLWVLALLGYGKKYLNRDSLFFRYANKAVYPFYILHQTAIVIIGYYVVRTSDDIVFKYLFIFFVSFWICISIYHLFIRPFPMVRYLFGSK